MSVKRELKYDETQIRIKAEKTNTGFGQAKIHGPLSKSDVNAVFKID